MESLRAMPPAGAVILFAGKNLANWISRDGGPAVWKVEGGLLEVVAGTGDILTRQPFGDFFLHLEFRCPHHPRAQSHERGNSGVYLQGRYELQILDSFGVKSPGVHDCGAIYGHSAPLVNASRPSMAWQTYEAVFRATRPHEPARVTVFHNNLVIHNNLALEEPTDGALDEQIEETGPILLQNHGEPVAFRHIWVLPLPQNGAH